MLKKNRLFKFIFFIVFICLSSDLLARAPFFRIQMGNTGKHIYLLGSIHTMRFSDAFSNENRPNSFAEINRIFNDLTPRFYIEHDPDNTYALKLMKEQSFTDQPLLNPLLGIISSNFSSIETHLDDYIFLTRNGDEVEYSTEFTIRDVLAQPLWLSSQTLYYHFGSLGVFEGGFERDLINLHGLNVEFLETSEDTLHILANAPSQESQALLRGALFFMNSFYGNDLEAIFQLKTSAEQEYEWSSCIVELPKPIDRSVIRRNRNWAIKIKQTIQQEGLTSDFFIVVGKDHFDSYKINKPGGESFLTFLLAEFGGVLNHDNHLERYDEESGAWIKDFTLHYED